MSEKLGRSANHAPIDHLDRDEEVVEYQTESPPKIGQLRDATVLNSDDTVSGVTKVPKKVYKKPLTARGADVMIEGKVKTSVGETGTLVLQLPKT